MKFYFSGINSRKTYSMLEKAGVHFFLVDQFDVRNTPHGREGTMLDSGSYLAWKNGWTLSLEFYAETARNFGPFEKLNTLGAFCDNQASEVSESFNSILYFSYCF
jgi:hypothetical protein